MFNGTTCFNNINTLIIFAKCEKSILTNYVHILLGEIYMPKIVASASHCLFLQLKRTFCYCLFRSCLCFLSFYLYMGRFNSLHFQRAAFKSLLVSLLEDIHFVEQLRFVGEIEAEKFSGQYEQCGKVSRSQKRQEVVVPSMILLILLSLEDSTSKNR